MWSEVELPGEWRSFQKPFRIFGPLIRIDEIVAESREAGFSWYSEASQTALKQVAGYVYDFLAQPHPNLGRDGNVCPFVPHALQRGLFRATIVGTSDLESVDAAMREIIPVFQAMAPASPPKGRNAEGDQILKSIIAVFPHVGADAAPEVIDALQRRLKSAYIRAGMMVGQFHPGCPEPGLHNPAFRPLQAPLACLAIRHITKYDAPFMDTDEYLDGYLHLFGLEGMRRIDAMRVKGGQPNLSGSLTTTPGPALRSGVGPAP
ncbi:conserved protein of unknown function [Bradyrhizobium sp. ORS 285]|uniref:DUF6875 domain-containing protein n=1 Tax=Bradyrhizobium sp. ORS 285 TaxID=115808 RepID=UPI000240B154|nr:hypothetical protein [Bradyrhizobium sp. ORS 285]CCD84772.1 conserved hypothetical protein [Bradyrhizobium sp. ORS 285]SMX56401.1 conserved protein of unknown function [Bradyrhizobium sp. ORS 285]